MSRPAVPLQEKDQERSEVAEKGQRKDQQVGDDVGDVLERVVVMNTRYQRLLGRRVVADRGGSNQQAIYKTNGLIRPQTDSQLNMLNDAGTL